MNSQLPKICGADIELANFILGVDHPRTTCFQSAQRVLDEIEGTPDRQAPSRELRQVSPAFRQWVGIDREPDGEDETREGSFYGRKYLSNGACAYRDHHHLELCLPEVLSAYDHLACWHALLRIATRALQRVNAELPASHPIQLLANNSDGRGNSYGSHLNFLVTRQAWNNIMLRKMHYLLYLASAQVSSIIFTGAGKVGSEHGRPPANFQLSQRADFYECLLSQDTTVHRPLVNSRDESLCNEVGRQNGLARLHCIFFDNTLCHVSSFLKVGVMQILLAQIEAEDADAALALEDPLEALQCWSRDPALKARARVVSGQDLTAVELQWRFLERAQRFCDRGGCDGIVPGANKILKTWESVLQQLEARDLDALAPRLDWVLKFGILDGVLSRQPQLGWDSPQIKHLDHLYSSLNPEEGLYRAFERSGRVEQLVTEKKIEQFVEQPPEDTRAWTRAMLLKKANGCVSSVDWDAISFRVQNGAWSSERTIALADPTRFTKEETEAVFKGNLDLDCMLDRLAALQESEHTFVGR